MDWIKTEERTPFIGDNVVAWNGQKQRICKYVKPSVGCDLYKTDKYKKWFQYIENDFLHEFRNVTHWMPLHDAPTE